MAHRENPFYGITINEIARVCQVDLTTARRWKRGARCPPKSAVLLILGDLGCFDPAWKGWRIYKGVLISPEGWEISKGDVISSPLLRQQLAAYKTELRRLKEPAVSIPDQPLPTEWPEWIKEVESA
jgi:Phage protein